MTSASTRFRQVADPIWEAQHNHPFVRGIGDGTLDAERFAFWLRQDYLYLIDYSRLFAAAVLRAWRERSPAASGVCAHDTTAALAVLCGMRRLGWTAPEDLAIVGVNDSAAAALADPPLTMVALDADVTARYTVDVITALVAERPLPAAPATGGASIVDRGSV